MGEWRLEVDNLHKKFPGVYAVKGVSFQIAPGEVHALVGENGAGKSTLMKMITGEYGPDEGTVRHNGGFHKGRNSHDPSRIGASSGDGHCAEYFPWRRNYERKISE